MCKEPRWRARTIRRQLDMYTTSETSTSGSTRRRVAVRPASVAGAARVDQLEARRLDKLAVETDVRHDIGEAIGCDISMSAVNHDQIDVATDAQLQCGAAMNAIHGKERRRRRICSWSNRFDRVRYSRVRRTRHWLDGLLAAFQAGQGRIILHERRLYIIARLNRRHQRRHFVVHLVSVDCGRNKTRIEMM